MLDRIHDLILWAVTAALAAAASGIWWLIRRIFTNQQEIELLKADLAHRAQLRAEDREMIAEMLKDIKSIQGVLMGGKNGD